MVLSMGMGLRLCGGTLLIRDVCCIKYKNMVIHEKERIEILNIIINTRCN